MPIYVGAMPLRARKTRIDAAAARVGIQAIDRISTLHLSIQHTGVRPFQQTANTTTTMRSLFLLALLAGLAAVGIELLTRRAYPVPAKVSRLIVAPVV